MNRPGSIQSAIYIGTVSIPRKDKDYFAIRTADTIYGGSGNDRLDGREGDDSFIGGGGNAILAV